MRVQDRREELVLSIGIEVGERHRRHGFLDLPREQLVGLPLGRHPGLLEVGGPRSPAVGDVHALQERRDDLPELFEHQLGIRPRLGQWVGAHPQQHHLEGLTARVDAHVRDRGCGEHAPSGVERLRPTAWR